MQSIIEALGELGELEWFEFSPLIKKNSDIKGMISPYMVWRFKEPNLLRDQEIESVINNFSGKVKWKLGHTDRNVFLVQENVFDFFYNHQYKKFLESRIDYAKQFPTDGSLAYEDCKLLTIALKHLSLNKEAR